MKISVWQGVCEEGSMVSRMKKTALLYIATGEYFLFWEDYFHSCEKYLLKNHEKHYYVFTDCENIYGEQECDRIHKIRIDAMPWPLITLLRFHIFLRVEHELERFDYLYFMNANLQCVDEISEEQIVPINEEELVVAQHPGFYKNESRFVASYDRNPKSTAYVPYNAKGDAVIGALIGGTAEGFLKMSRELRKNIDIDLQNRVIAQWHDESHLNHYIILHKGAYKLLSPAYCYPEQLQLDYKPKIVMVLKQRKFDVDKFKGYGDYQESFKDKVWRNINKILPYQNILCLRDYIIRKKVR